MTYKQALQYLFEQLPMFHRIGAAAYKANLNNTLALCKALNHPETKFPSIHIAGTNGKGSTSHFVASILQEAGYKTGLFTSPHLKDFRERIKINGKPIPKQDVIRFLTTNKAKFADIQPSFFEWTFALASNYFAEQHVDIAIMETGMGGRLDSTNVVNPVICCITNIDFDHTQFLGNTREVIATEKAGIIKQGIPIVIGETHHETELVFKETASSKNAEIMFADKEFVIRKHNLEYKNRPLLKAEYITTDNEVIKLISPLTGLYQLKNLRNALAIATLLKQKGYTITSTHIKKGIRNVVSNTGLKGRWQLLSKQPLCIADIGHNPAGIQEILNQLAITPFAKLHFVLGMVNDKDITTMLAMLPIEATYYFCKADIPRGLDAQELRQKAQAVGLNGNTYASVKEALTNALSDAETNDLVLVGGSAFVVAEVI